MPYSDSKELISFYNVENLFSPDPPPVHRLDPTNSGLRNWDQKRYDNKLFKIAHVFGLIQEKHGVLPMLIGLSEIQGQKPLDELAAMAPFDSNYGVVHYDSLDERGIDVALLYDKAKLQLLSSEPLTYFFEIADNNPANYDTTRDILHCRLQYEGRILNVFVLHLPSKREDDVNLPKRQYMLRELRKTVLQLTSGQNEAVVICGDFNENPDENYIKDLRYDDEKNEFLKNPFYDLFESRNFSTFHREDGLLFDQVVLSNNFFNSDFPLQYRAAEVFNPPQLASWDRKFEGRPFRTYAGTRYLGGYSDHFPIVVEWEKLISNYE
ncbi:endonuclease/exonuclease/phosphatase family protein [Kaistella palustris]|uniref:endonuclease/exonuclease/phosphatase family protein n=1 Tax=Kaistella palustris TaxID=493376 RepID=UPI00040E115E|nr:endonuclease/exonuclease/phosphatase family protein [Kaistella palustris]